MLGGDACTFEIFSNVSLAMLTKLSNLKWHESMKNHSQLEHLSLEEIAL